MRKAIVGFMVMVMVGAALAEEKPKEKPKLKPKPVAIEKIRDMIPKELLVVTNNDAKDQKFDANRVDEWLKENIVGRECFSEPFMFDGYVKQIVAVHPRGPLGLDDIGGYEHHFSYGMCISKADQKEALGKLQDGQWVIVNGKVRVALIVRVDEAGKKSPGGVHCVFDNVVLKPSKKPK